MHMSDITELKQRLDHIEDICEKSLQTPGFPKEVILKHVAKVANGKISKDDL